MDPLTVAALASASIKLIQQLMPSIRDALQGGELSAADQSKLRAEYDSLRGQLGNEYQGSHWNLSGRG